MSAATEVPAQPVFSPTKSQLDLAYLMCSGIARTAAKNFYYGFMALPRRKRLALCAVYAFMRKCDDICDDPKLPLEERRVLLGKFLAGLHAAQAGEPTDDPIYLALTDAQRRFSIPAELLDQLAQGTAMDLEEEAAGAGVVHRSGLPVFPVFMTYRTFDDLYPYCYRVASVVGLVCIKIFGYQNPEAEPLAERTGIAFQLTNILRDLKEDALQCRVYLPQDELLRYGRTALELRNGADAVLWRPLMAMEAARAMEFYRSAEKLIPLVNPDSRAALKVLVTIYRRLLEKMQQRGYDVFSRRIRLSTNEKLSILLQALWRRTA